MSIIRAFQEEQVLYNIYPCFHKSIRKGWKIPWLINDHVQEMHQFEIEQKWRTERLKLVFTLFPALLSRYKNG